MKNPRITIAEKLAVIVLGLAAFVFPRLMLSAQAPATPAVIKDWASTLRCDGTKLWVDTNVDLPRPAVPSCVLLRRQGQITYPQDTSYKGKGRTIGAFGPDGLPRGWADLIHQYAVKDAGHGALIGRIGSDAYAQAFQVGASKEFTAPVGGRLFLGINQSMSDASAATGSFAVKIEVLEEGSATGIAAGGPPETRIHGITPELLSQIPRRISDPNNNPGDMVNVLIVGTEEQMVQTFTAAGWVKVDKSVGNAMLSAVMGTMEKKDYLTMPMSILYLFKRPQDYGFAHAEPVKVAMSRNHLRVWKSPYEVGGRPLWCVAATHDIGFERDQRNNGLTHKIDPAIDGEREYVNGTLSQTGLVIERRPRDPRRCAMTTAQDGNGCGEFHSDGRIVVLVLRQTTTASN